MPESVKSAVRTLRLYRFMSGMVKADVIYLSEFLGLRRVVLVYRRYKRPRGKKESIRRKLEALEVVGVDLEVEIGCEDIVGAGR